MNLENVSVETLNNSTLYLRLMQRRAEVTISIIVIIALGLLVLSIFAGQLVHSRIQFEERLSSCQQQAGVCKTACDPRGQAMLYACEDESETCCLLSGEPVRVNFRVY